MVHRPPLKPQNKKLQSKFTQPHGRNFDSPFLIFRPQPKTEPEPTPEAQESEESDIEIDNEGVVEPDNEEPQAMGDEAKEPTEEEMDQAGELRSKAAAAFSERNFEEAIKLYTEAIQLNPHNALYHAKRGQAYLKLVKPNACIRDCDRAEQINGDCAAAYKFRGRAHRLLGNWESAAKDLRQACKLDYDEEADEWLREVTPNAKKLEAHRLKQERRRAEREERERRERVRRAQEANKKAREEAAAGMGMEGDDDDFMGNLGGGADFMNAFKDPEVAAAMQDILQNPSNISKYMGNPKIMALLSKIGGSMGGAGGGFPGFPGAGFPGAGAGAFAGAGAGAGSGGFPGTGGFPGAGSFPGFGGFPGAGAGPAPGADAPPKPKPDFHDDGLD